MEGYRLPILLQGPLTSDEGFPFIANFQLSRCDGHDLYKEDISDGEDFAEDDIEGGGFRSLWLEEFEDETAPASRARAASHIGAIAPWLKAGWLASMVLVVVIHW